jgi:hypothetical protein
VRHDVGIPTATPLRHHRSRPIAPQHDERGSENGSSVRYEDPKRAADVWGERRMERWGEVDWEGRGGRDAAAGRASGDISIG